MSATRENCDIGAKINTKRNAITPLISLAMSLTAYGTLNKRAYAALPCPISSILNINSIETNSVECDIQPSGSLNILESGALTNTSTGSFNNFSTLAVEGYLSNLGHINNQAYLSNKNLAVLLNDGTLDNDSLFSNDGSFANLNDGTLKNSGTINNKSNGYFDNRGTLSNLVGGNFSNHSTITNTGNINNYGELNNQSRIINDVTGAMGSINNHEGGVFTSSSAIYNSNGTVDNAGTFINSGLISNNSYEYDSPSKIINQSSGTMLLESTSRLYNSSYLVNKGELTNQGEIMNFGARGSMVNEGSFNNTGSIYTSYTGSTINAFGATFINDGSLSLFTGLENDGRFVQRGSMYTVEPIINSASAEFHLQNNPNANENADLKIISNFENSGLFTIGEDTTFTYELFHSNSYNSFTQLAGSTIVNGQMEQAKIDILGGTLSGSGSITSVDTPIHIAENATVAPGNSTGSLILNSDLDLFGTLDIEITDSTLFDILEVDGIVSFSDTTIFDFTLAPSFSQFNGASLDFLFANTFVNIDLLDFSQFSISGLATGYDWNISFDRNASFAFASIDFFRTNPVSAPTTWLCFVLGVPLLTLFTRRKRNFL